MRWFKHFSDNYRGRSVASFHREFGHTGVSWYFLLTEICTEKLEKNLHRDLATPDCRFSFDVAFVESALRGTIAKITRWLRHGEAMGLWKFTMTSSELHVDYPILLELLDRDVKKTRLKRDMNADRPRPDKDKDKEVDTELDKDKELNTSRGTKNTKSPEASKLNKEIWDAYSQSFFNRYQTEPIRNAAVNSKISQLAKRLGPDAVDVVKFFLNHNDSFYLKQVHAIGLCLKDAESLHTQWKRNRPITKADVQAFEKNSEFESQWERLSKEELS